MLHARSTVNGIFSDLGLEAESLNQLKVGGVGPGHSVPHTFGVCVCGRWVLGTGFCPTPAEPVKGWHPSRACCTFKQKGS